MRKIRKTRLESTLFVFILPWLIGFLGFRLYPLISSFYYSFTKFGILDTPTFIGLGNYIEMFTDDPLFFKSVSVTLIYVIVSVPLKLGFALFVAVILNNKLKFAPLYRTVYYIPSLLGSSVGIAVVWRGLFRKTGIINYILSLFGIAGLELLGDQRTALGMLILLSVWQFGSSMIIFLAGLNQVPASVRESAAIDGANTVQTFFHVSLPMITPVIFFNLIMQCINAFQTFSSAYIITKNGGPANATYLYVLHIYNSGFSKYRLGYASALSWILMAVILVFTLIVFKTQDNWVHYESGGKEG